MKSYRAAALFLFLLLTTYSFGQVAVRPIAPGRVYRGYNWGYSYPWGGGGTSADESRARGMAELIRAEADAAKAREEIKAKQAENELQRARIYQEKRKIYEARKAQEAAKRKERIARRQARYAQQSREPKKPFLTPEQLDPITGEISWPVGLEGAAFKGMRAQLENDFAQRASAGGILGADEAGQVDETIDAMENELKKYITTLPTGDYLLAKNFLKGLKESV